MKTVYIPIIGDIDGTMVGSVFDLLTNSRVTEPDRVVIGIHSEGGDISAGYALIDLIKVLAGDTPIHTVNLGDVSSAALDIYMLGEHRYGTRMCEFVIHRGYIQPSDGARFRAEDLKAEIPGLEMDDLMLFNETLAGVKLPKTLKKKLLLGKDVELDRKKARRYGIINEGGLPWDNERKST